MKRDEFDTSALGDQAAPAGGTWHGEADDFTGSNEQPLYTLDEARRELARRECEWLHHDWEIIERADVGPISLVCSRCGDSRAVVPPK